MDSPKQGSNYVSEQVQKAFSGASKEANKEPGKDPKGSWGTKYAIAVRRIWSQACI